MKTATGTECPAWHAANGFSDENKWRVYEWDGRRYTVCAHPLVTPDGNSKYCGNLIDVTDLPQVTLCCGKH